MRDGEWWTFDFYLFSAFACSETTTKCDIVTADIVEQLINEIAKIKTQLSNAELQLYEANEKMAEITENVSEKWDKMLWQSN